MLDGHERAEHPVETSPSSVSSPIAWVVICSVVEFIISATFGQSRCAAAIAEKSISCASTMAASMGRSGAASPSSGQSSAARAGEGSWLGGGGCGRWAAQGVRYHVLLAWCVSDVRCEFGNEGELLLLAGRPRQGGAKQGCDERLVVGQ
jgi:hypothetical protein